MCNNVYSILRCIARGLYKKKSNFFEKFNDAGYTWGADYTQKIVNFIKDFINY
jgi:hypothetical protein